MAITIVQHPDTGASANYNSAHAPLWHVVTSSNVAQPDFRFVFDISFISGETYRLKVSPNASNQGVIDASRVVRSLITGDYFSPLGIAFSPFTMNTNAIVVNYIVNYGEEYSGTVYPDLTTHSYYAYNAYAADTPGQYGLRPVLPKAHNWATDRPLRTIYMPRDGRVFLSYINDPSDTLSIQVLEVDEDGIAVNPLDLYDAGPYASYNRLVVLNLNMDYLAAALPSLPPPFPASTAAGYALTITGGVSGVSDEIIVRWMCEPKTVATPLHFLNRYGAFDTYYFTGPTRKELNLERTEYERIGMVSTGGVIREYDNTNNVYAPTKTHYATEHTWTRKLSSGFVDDITHEWLWQLVASPQVFIELDGFCYPVLIRTNRWTEKITRFDKLYNLEIEVEMGRNVVSQYR